MWFHRRRRGELTDQGDDGGGARYPGYGHRGDKALPSARGLVTLTPLSTPSAGCHAQERKFSRVLRMINQQYDAVHAFICYVCRARPPPGTTRCLTHRVDEEQCPRRTAEAPLTVVRILIPECRQDTVYNLGLKDCSVLGAMDARTLSHNRARTNLRRLRYASAAKDAPVHSPPAL
nr:hypothetical protein CFP56_37277 [Quercus suber]